MHKKQVVGIITRQYTPGIKCQWGDLLLPTTLNSNKTCQGSTGESQEAGMLKIDMAIQLHPNWVELEMDGKCTRILENFQGLSFSSLGCKHVFIKTMHLS